MERCLGLGEGGGLIVKRRVRVLLTSEGMQMMCVFGSALRLGAPEPEFVGPVGVGLFEFLKREVFLFRNMEASFLRGLLAARS
jgi:hypothetical protein